MRISDWSSDVCSSDLKTTSKNTGLAFRCVRWQLRPCRQRLLDLDDHLWRQPCELKTFLLRVVDDLGVALTQRAVLEAELPTRCLARDPGIRAQRRGAHRKFVRNLYALAVQMVLDRKSTRLNSSH